MTSSVYSFTVPPEVIDALKAENQSIKKVAAVIHDFHRQMMFETGFSPDYTAECLSETLIGMGYEKSKSTILGYYNAVEWMLEQVGEIRWVKNRSFEQHKNAAAWRWDYIDLVRKTAIRSVNGKIRGVVEMSFDEYVARTNTHIGGVPVRAKEEAEGADGERKKNILLVGAGYARLYEEANDLEELL